MQAAASNDISANPTGHSTQASAGANGSAAAASAHSAALASLADHQLAQLVQVLRLLGQDQLTAVLRLLDPTILQPALNEYLKHVGSENAAQAAAAPAPQAAIPPQQAAMAQTPVAQAAPVQAPAQQPQAQPRSIAEAMAQGAARNALPATAAAPAPVQAPAAAPVQSAALAPSAAPAPVNNDRPASKPAAKAKSGYSRRESPRQITTNNARIVAKGDRRGIDCQILDVSDTGALLRVDKNLTIAENFLLYDFGQKKPTNVIARMPHKSCEVVWRKRNKMGVRFIG